MKTIPRQSRLWSWALPVTIFAASVAIRVAAWMYFGTGTIESEGAEYAKMAENLRNGIGLVGLVAPGPQVLFNPLFPIMIAAVSYVVPDFEVAGRLVSIVMGSLLPVAVLGIGSRLFNRKVGIIAALMSMLHPLSVYLSFMVYSEGPYATLLLTAIYCTIRAIDARSTVGWPLVGGAFGLCYLLRAEAVAAFGIALLFAILAVDAPIALRLKRAGYALAVFLILALPQIIFLRQSTGKVLLETKSRILFSYAGRRILEAERNPGKEYVSDAGNHETPSGEVDGGGGYPLAWQEKWATYGIDTQLNGTGFAMRPWSEMARETRVRVKELFPLILKGIRRNVPNLFVAFSERWLGAPLLPALALYGACRRPWRGARAATRRFVLAITAAPIAATFFVLWGDSRYFFIFVPLLCIWAANGLVEVGRWLDTSIAMASWNGVARQALMHWLVPGVIALAMLANAVKPVTRQYEFLASAPPTRIDKDMGTWIAHQQAGQVRIMDLTLPLSFHADAQQHLYFPYATGDLALRYLNASRVDYIVLRKGEKFTKYYADWLANGIPDARAELVRLPSEAFVDRFVVYRWRQSGELESAVQGRN